MKYDYRCLECETVYEVEVITTSTLEGRRRVSPKCPNCGKRKSKKIFLPTRVIYKGKGFYHTDKEDK